jgi:hypothetical protein
MASADFWQFSRTSLYGLLLWKIHSSCRQCVYQISPIKCSNCHPMSPLHLHYKVRVVLDFVLFGKLVRFIMPCMQFLFVGAGLCLRLPSDSTSRWTPLPLANGSYYQAHSGLSPPSYCTCRANQTKK